MKVLLILPFVASLAFGEDRVTQKEVDAAIAKGAKFLASAPADRFDGRSDELVALALAHAGVRPSQEPLKGLLDRIVRGQLTATYNVALQAVLLLVVDPKKYRNRLADCGQWLIDSQSPNGQWTYGGSLVRTPERTVASGNGEGTITLKAKGDTVAGGGGGDNSNSQFGLLGLWAVSRAGIKVPASPFERAERWWKSAQESEVRGNVVEEGAARGWGYGSGGPATPSMTCAGVAAMAICGMGLGAADRNRPQMSAGMRWLGAHFAVIPNYYYLYSLERAGTITGEKLIGGHDWYQEGARFLIDGQGADGSWTGGYGGTIDTCFAILFLKRATESLTGGAGGLDRASVTPDDPATEPVEPEADDGKK